MPPWTSEKVVLQPYDPRWIDRARTENDRVEELLEPWLVDGVQHIGSTAVVGLIAKPIIDLIASVRDLSNISLVASGRLTAEGWTYVDPEFDAQPWRRFFIKTDTSGRHRQSHLHIVQAGGSKWVEMISFRDALRHDHVLARRYEDLKVRLAEQHKYDRKAYTMAKTEFVMAALRALPADRQMKSSRA